MTLTLEQQQEIADVLVSQVPVQTRRFIIRCTWRGLVTRYQFSAFNDARNFERLTAYVGLAGTCVLRDLFRCGFWGGWQELEWSIER